MSTSVEGFLGSRRFELLGLIGDGGGGVVYRARDKDLGRHVAVKVMRDSEQDGMVRFRHAFETLKQLKHPQLVQLYEIVEEQGRTLLVMELVEGVELLDYVRTPDGGFDEHKLRRAFGQLAQALRALHHARKLHRDVKPSNVRVTPEGRVVLLDLDLAIDLDEQGERHELHGTGRPIGTAVYMAPEQATARTLGPAADWYSFGVVLYEALTGTLPYRGSDLEILLTKQHGRPEAPSTLGLSIPPDLDSLCVDLLVVDSERRPLGVQVLRRLGASEDVPSGRLSLASMLSRSLPFIGREHELDRLMNALERSRVRPVIVRLTGEVGVGKSTLCEEFQLRLTRDPRNVLVLASACPRYPDVPHAALHEPLSRISESLREERSSVKLPVSASALRLLERAFPGSVLGLEPKTPGRSALAPDSLEQRWRAIAALRTIVAEACAQRPLVLWIDDYQWADLDTQRLVSALVFGQDAPRLLLVLSEDALSDAPPSSQPAAHEVITLTSLTPVEARSLAERSLEHATGSTAMLAPVFWRDGLPLLLQERLRYALFFGEAPDEKASCEALVERRTSELSPAARRILEVLSAAFDPIREDVCERASELSRADFSRELSALRVGGLVRAVVRYGEEFLAPGHALLVSVTERGLEPAQRASLHARLSLALVARDPARASGRLLRHQGEGGDTLAAAESARVAAIEAHEALAFQRAAELFTLCASLRPPGRDEAGYLLLRRMADALANAGWASKAASVYREAALGAQTADALHMRQRAAEHLLRSAEIEAGLEAVRELLRSIELTLPETARRVSWSMRVQRTLLAVRGLKFKETDEGQSSARDLRRVDVLWSAGTQLSLVDVVRGGDFLARGLRAALKVGEPHRVARALCSEAWSTVGTGQAGTRRTEFALQSARALVERLNSPLLDGQLRLSQGMVALNTFRMTECQTHCLNAERVFRDNCADVVWEVTTAQVHQLAAEAFMARYDTMSEKLERCLREADERGDVWGYSHFLSIGAMSTKLARNLPHEAAEDVREATSRWTSRAGGLHFQHLFSLLAGVYIELYRDQDSALELLEQSWPELREKMFLQVPFARTTLYELRARARVLSSKKRKSPSLLKGAEADAKKLARSRDPVAVGFAHLVVANVEQQRGERVRARAQLERGVQLLDGYGLHPWSLAARVALGGLVAGDEGTRMASVASADISSRGVRDVARYVAMMMPAFAQV